MDPAVAAKRMLDALKAGERELILAEGGEAELAKMRRANPNALFDAMERMVAAGYAQRMGAEKK